MQSTTQTAKQRAEAKFKSVGTKLNEQDFNAFERLLKERGFANGSQYIKHLIDFDTLGDIENERKQNAILTDNIATYKARINKLEALIDNFDEKFNKQNEALNRLINITHNMGENIKKLNEDKAQPTQEVESGLKSYFKGLFNIGRK